MRYRKKPVVIEAVRWDGENIEAVLTFMDPVKPVYLFDNERIGISTLEGTLTANRGDWIIRGVAGEFYPCKPDIFDATYEPVE